MSTPMITPCILSGGAGTRLWPLSREAYPKQFLPLTGEQNLFSQTLARITHLPNATAPLVICNADHRFLVAENLRLEGHDTADIVLEPVGRNTAPAAAIAALAAQHAHGDNALLLLMPADHVIENPTAFVDAVNTAEPLAATGSLITFGIVPHAPETGYGYIRAGDALATNVHAVAEFVEKPDAETAARYVTSGEYAWNSGIFLFSARSYLDALAEFAPAIHSACQAAYAAATQEWGFTQLDAAAFARCPSDSIDYAVMEKTNRAAVVPVDMGWSDVGAWNALAELGTADAQGNVLRGDVLTEQANNNLIRAESRLVVALGVHDQIIVETADAVLVADKQHAQDVKKIVAQLNAVHREEPVHHQRVFRPWGWYESISCGERFQVKRISVSPGKRLSLQLHHQRAEHWIVVRGTARVTRGDAVFTLTEDHSTYIPIGTKHRLENPTDQPLEIIEVQSGTYLGEDDIVRFDDDFGR